MQKTFLLPWLIQSSMCKKMSCQTDHALIEYYISVEEEIQLPLLRENFHHMEYGKGHNDTNHQK